MVKIIVCPNCKPHAYQDEKYGKNNRVANSVAKSKEKTEYRCTVCEKIS